MLGFDNENIGIESDQLKNVGDSFKCKFLECGTYNYKCQIFSSRMKGCIEVVTDTDYWNKVVWSGNSKNINKLFQKSCVTAPNLKGAGCVTLVP